MTAFWKAHKKALCWGLAGLLAAWCLWYARPVDIHFLLGDNLPDTSSYVIHIMHTYGPPPRVAAPKDAQEQEALTAELISRLEDLRFHRSPLEPLLRLLPTMGRSARNLDGETDYSIHLTFHRIRPQEEWEPLLSLMFWVDRWSYGPYNKLPLYVLHGQEKGRELGAWLWELAGDYNSIS